MTRRGSKAWPMRRVLWLVRHVLGAAVEMARQARIFVDIVTVSTTGGFGCNGSAKSFRSSAFLG